MGLGKKKSPGVEGIQQGLERSRDHKNQQIERGGIKLVPLNKENCEKQGIQDPCNCKILKVCKHSHSRSQSLISELNFGNILMSGYKIF